LTVSGPSSSSRSGAWGGRGRIARRSASAGIATTKTGRRTGPGDPASQAGRRDGHRSRTRRRGLEGGGGGGGRARVGEVRSGMKDDEPGGIIGVSSPITEAGTRHENQRKERGLGWIGFGRLVGVRELCEDELDVKIVDSSCGQLGD
jgi:hypothetical protein